MPIVPAGQTNLAAAGIPNVLVQIIPPNPLLNGVPTDIIANVGTGSWGPVNSPTEVGSMSEQIQSFGTPQNLPHDLGTAVYLESQEGANSFVCVRVTDGTDLAASVGVTDSTMSPVIGVILSAVYTGSQGNQIYAQISSGSGSTPSALTYKISIYMAGNIPEVFDNIGGVGDAFWLNLANAINLGQGIGRGPSELVTAVHTTGVTAVTVTSSSTDWSAAPTVAFSGGGGTDAAATALLGFPIFNYGLTNPGTGYTSAPTVAIVSADGTGSGGLAHSILGFPVASVTIGNAGSGYTTATIAPSGGSGTGFAATANLSGGSIASITITNHGQDYLTAPTLLVTGDGSSAALTAVLDTVGRIRSFVSDAPGQGYHTPPLMVLSGGGGVGGVGTTSIGSSGGVVTKIVITSSGSNYATAPTVTISGGTGTSATATAAVATAGAPAFSLFNLVSGTDGNSAVTDTILIGVDGTTRTGMYALRKTDASLGVLVGSTDPTKYTLQQIFGSQEGIYMIAAIAAGYQNNINGAISIKQNAGVNSYFLKLTQGDWIQFNDIFNGVTRYVSPQAKSAGILAALDPSQSSLNKQLHGIVATQKSAASQVYSDADLLALQTNGIDVITKPVPGGDFFGWRLGVNTSSNIATNTDNYTRMVIFLAKTLDQGMGEFIGQVYSPDVVRTALNTIQGFLNNLVQLNLIGAINGGPAFQVVMDTSQVARGILIANVAVVLFGIIQRFVINLNAQQGVNIEILPAQ